MLVAADAVAVAELVALEAPVAVVAAVVARQDLPQLLSLAADAVVEAVDVAAAVVLVADPTAPQRLATAQAVDAVRNGRPASRTIFRIRR